MCLITSQQEINTSENKEPATPTPSDDIIWSSDETTPPFKIEKRKSQSDSIMNIINGNRIVNNINFINAIWKITNAL